MSEPAPTTTEAELWQAVFSGQPFDRRTGVEAEDDPQSSAGWGPERTVRASHLRAVLTRTPGPGMVILRGVRITGPLVLETATLSCPLYMRGCAFDSPVNLIRAKVPDLELSGSALDRVVADGAEVAGNFVLDRSKSSVVSLIAAHVAGQVSLNEAVVEYGPWPLDTPDATLADVEPDDVQSSQRLDDAALVADQLRADGGVYCRDGFEAHGSVRFPGAQIGGPLDLVDAKLDGPLVIRAAHVSGALGLVTARLGAAPRSVEADLLKVDQGLFAPGLVAAGAVDLGNTTITGTLNLVGADIGGALELADAHVLGSFDMQQAKLRGVPLALDADLSTVDRLASWEKLKADGRVKVANANFAGSLNLSGAEFRAALVLAGTGIGGNLALDGSILVGPRSPQRGVPVKPGLELTPAALDLHQAAVGLTLNLRPAEIRDGVVDLNHLKVGRLADGPVVWRSTARVRGLSYDDVEAEPHASSTAWEDLLGKSREVVDARARIDWFKGDEDSGAEPFERLAAFYRAAGDGDSARYVAVQRELLRRGEMAWPGRLWSRFLGATVGFGYRTWQAALWLAGFAILGSLLLSGEHDKHHFAPAKTAGLPDFDSLLYSLDSLIPVVNLHQRDSFVPHHLAGTWFVLATFAGWALTTAVVAAVTARVRRVS